MIIARQLQQTNRAEYLLYMWQVEDILRLYRQDIDKIDADYLVRFNIDNDQRVEMRQWYADLCDMMRTEHKQDSGHLQITQNVIIGLADLHDQLFQSDKYPYYKQMYYKVLPYVVELRAKRKESQGMLADAFERTQTEGELTLLFEFLYGIMLLRLQQKAVSEETARAAADITAFLGQLSEYWNANKQGKLELG